MDRIESYLGSVRKSLDVRSDAERNAIILEVRDHLLESVTRFEAEGLSHGFAIEKAIKSLGDNRLVATSISEAHDGGSWRQAWIAAAPLGFSLLWLLSRTWLIGRIVMWPIDAGFLMTAIACYAYFSPRTLGRKWRPPWLAMMLSAGFFTLVDLSYWIALPGRFRSVPDSYHGRGIPGLVWSISEDTAFHRWLTVFGHWVVLCFIVAVSVFVVAMLVRRRRWVAAALAPAPLFLYALEYLNPAMGGQTLVLFVLLPPLHYLVLSLWAVYLLFIEELKMDWTMAWAFALVVSAPPALMPIPNVWPLAFALVKLLIIAAGIIWYVLSTRRAATAAFYWTAMILCLALSVESYFLLGKQSFLDIGPFIKLGGFQYFIEHYDRKYRERLELQDKLRQRQRLG